MIARLRGMRRVQCETNKLTLKMLLNLLRIHCTLLPWLRELSLPKVDIMALSNQQYAANHGLSA